MLHLTSDNQKIRFDAGLITSHTSLAITSNKSVGSDLTCETLRTGLHEMPLAGSGQSAMDRCQEVTLLCEPGDRVRQDQWRAVLGQDMAPLLTMAVLVTCVMGLALTLPMLHFHLVGTNMAAVWQAAF